jgi:hypothetical protein
MQSYDWNKLIRRYAEMWTPKTILRMLKASRMISVKLVVIADGTAPEGGSRSNPSSLTVVA